MTWLPNPTVTLGTADVSAFAVGQVSVRRGRDNVYAASQAGYASVELIDVDGGAQVEVGEMLSVALDDTAGNPVTVFTGLVSDWERSVRQTFDGEPVTVTRLSVVGPIGRLNRRQVFAAGRVSEDDGARILETLELALAQTWEETSPSLSWGSVGTAVTWDTFDPFLDLTVVDPGVYTLAALGSADGGYSALSVAQDAAFSGAGILWETRDGHVAYADADRRAANGTAFLDIPVAEVAADSIRVTSNLADVTNRVFVEYDGGVASAEDVWSIPQYGVQALEISTQLVNLSNAQARADDYILRHASPQLEFQQVQVNLNGAGSALRDALLEVDPNAAVQVSGVPAKVGFTLFEGFVEGVELTADRFRAEVGLLVSDKTLSVSSIRWGQVAGTLAWSAVGSAVTWADARTL